MSLCAGLHGRVGGVGRAGAVSRGDGGDCGGGKVVMVVVVVVVSGHLHGNL